MVTDKLINQFLVFLYKWHVAEYGESISTLPSGGIHVLDKLFPSECPEAVISLDENTIKDLTPNLAKELQARGLAEYESLVVTLTPEGYEKAKSLAHPVRHYLAANYRWMVPFVIAGIIIPIVIALL